MFLKIKGIMSLVLFFAVLGFSGCEKINHADLFEGEIKNQPIIVMTYNVYLGSSTEPVLNVSNLLQVPTEVANVYNNFIQSNFPARATEIAKSIKEHQPHLIGLQEMSLIRSQSPGDRILGGLVPASEVVMDFRSVLLDALSAEGLNYRIAGEVENVDVEMPMLTDEGIVDIRLTDYDVILAREDVGISELSSTNFTNTYSVDMLGLEIKRGYVGVNATINGNTYRFINTHLEAFSQDIRVSQTRELIDGLSQESLPIILLGDFNTEAPSGESYSLLIEAGYMDAWVTDMHGSGETCCQDADLLNEANKHFKRIDHIFVGSMVSNLLLSTTKKVGDSSETRKKLGMWPSDHSGVVSKLFIK